MRACVPSAPQRVSDALSTHLLPLQTLLKIIFVGDSGVVSRHTAERGKQRGWRWVQKCVAAAVAEGTAIVPHSITCRRATSAGAASFCWLFCWPLSPQPTNHQQGKTCLIERMFSNRFDTHLPATIGEAVRYLLRGRREVSAGGCLAKAAVLAERGVNNARLVCAVPRCASSGRVMHHLSVPRLLTSPCGLLLHSSPPHTQPPPTTTTTTNHHHHHQAPTSASSGCV